MKSTDLRSKTMICVRGMVVLSQAIKKGGHRGSKRGARKGHGGSGHWVMPYSLLRAPADSGRRSSTLDDTDPLLCIPGKCLGRQLVDIRLRL